MEMEIFKYKEHRGFERVIQLGMLLIIILLLGTSGFVYLENLSPFEALYLTIVTVTTVGYGDIVPLNPSGRIFSIFLILFGVGTFLYGLSVLIGFLVGGEIKDITEAVRMRKEIKGKKGHIVVLGYGTIGANVVERLNKENKDFVVIEKDGSKVEELKQNRIWVVQGDATIEETLKEANIKEASGLISALATDADNLIACLAAKDLNRDLRIVSRVTRRENIERFLQLGVNKIILPEYIGGLRMVDALLKPRLIKHFGIIGISESAIELDDITVSELSDFVGKSLEEANIPEKYDIVLAAIEREGELIIPPKAEDRIEAGDTLILIGKREGIKRFSKALAP